MFKSSIFVYQKRYYNAQIYEYSINALLRYPKF
jgi:hypothetical protein